MRIAIAGQKWLGCALLDAASDRWPLAGCQAPHEGDRLWQAAARRGVPVNRRLPPVEADVLVLAHAHAYVSAEEIGRFRLGAIAYHPSLLPLHRGRDAIRWTLRLREPVTGGTVYRVTEHVDGGPILLQDWCHVRPDDTAESLWRRELAPLGLRLLMEALARLERGAAVERPQDERLATWEPAFARRPLRQSDGPDSTR